MSLFKYLLLISVICCSCQEIIHTTQNTEQKTDFDVIVLGEGTGAIAAAIQSARSGAETLLVNPQAWLGGMLTSAGVSATDGNHKLHAGLWAEWRQLIRNHYGGADSLFTGWVSNTMFEPKIGQQYWNYLASKESKLTIYNSTKWSTITKEENWIIHIPSKNVDTRSKILIDGTDLGDVAAQVGATYDIGMDSQEETGESMAPALGNDIIQDFTYVAILKDFGKGNDKTIVQPANYDKELYDCSCQHNCDDPKMHPCQTMLDYGKLPNGKYMINWPFHGNDYYANIVELKAEERELIYQKAREHTLGFVYYIQTELDYSHLGLADDEFPTEDRLAAMPYHREGRRIKGMTQLTVNHMQHPYRFELYRTGVAVGDYPIDHHHAKNPDAPEIDFPNVPSFNIPVGCLIPEQIENFLIADKAISVSNIANGATRLQPVIIQVGQAAGIIAAHATSNNIPISQINVREIQNKILDANGYIMPFIDVSPEDDYFKAVQRVASTGILKGRPVPYKWANQTWFDPDSLIHVNSLLEDLIHFNPGFTELELLGKHLSQTQLQDVIQQFCQIYDLSCQDNQQKIIPYNVPVTRAEFSMKLDLELDLFKLCQVDFNGDNLD